MHEILLKIRYLERGLSKTLYQISNIVFPLNPVPFNGKSYQKRKGHETSDQSLFRLQSKFTKMYLFVSLTKFDGVT